MVDPRFAILTPSYAPDFERCELLARSVKEFVDPAIKHYIIVDRRDLDLFQQLAGPRTEIVVKESILPRWLFRLPFGSRWWFSLKTPPVRGWILQQAVKLAMPSVLDEDVFVFVDSDVAFVRPWSGNSFIRDGRVRLYRMPGEGDLESQHAWHQSTARLLGLPPSNYFGARYISQVVAWRRDNVLKLHQQIERTTGRPWIEAVLRQLHLSEYILYGVFVDEILRENSGHWHDSQVNCLEYWGTQPLSQASLKSFFQELQPHHVAVMLCAKAGMDVHRYRDLMEAAGNVGTNG